MNTKVMDLQEAKASGAIAMFGEKYDSEVRVVDVPGVSKELCGGTHVTNTSEIGGFKVTSEAGIASGVRRIEAVSGPSLMPYVDGLNHVVQQTAASLKVSASDIPARVATMQKDLFAREKQIAALKIEVAAAKAEALAGKVCTRAVLQHSCAGATRCCTIDAMKYAPSKHLLARCARALCVSSFQIQVLKRLPCTHGVHRLELMTTYRPRM